MPVHCGGELVVLGCDSRRGPRGGEPPHRGARERIRLDPQAAVGDGTTRLATWLNPQRA